MGDNNAATEPVKFMDEFAAIAALSEIVTEFGADHVYTNPKGEKADEAAFIDCFYVHTDNNGEKSAGCIVGKVLANVGVPLGWLERNEGARPDILANYMRDEGVYTVTPLAAKVLRRAQLAQDEGASWGMALYAAKGYLDGYRGAKYGD